jgi:RND family efflux transporter MFP subunit
VKVAPATKRTLQLNEEITGTVRAKTRAVIEAKISGRVLAMNATLGQFVKAGDVLATLDAQEMQARAESAKAMLDQATSDERRTASLVATNAVSKSDYDAAKARLEVAKASVSEAQTMLGYAKVTAPFDGVITRKLADQGDLAAPGKPLLDLENPAQLRIEADIPEALIASLKIGATLDVTPKAKAIVAEISPTGDPNSRTFPVKLDLPAGNTMRPGQFVRIAVPVREYEALVIPAAALVTSGQLQMVFVNEKNVAKLRLIRTGRERSEGIEVLAGLDGGESLVIEGADKLMDGQPLSVTP